MTPTRRYNLINNALGWLCFIIAAVSYLLTLEPTASFWDCPEFITQGYKLEVGHPPGNPIFMLTARFFINFVGSDPGAVAWAVNAMNALLSAATILLLFWTITHLMRRLLNGYKPLEELSVAQQIVIFASGLTGALAYAWSDTFWYSAVEGEVYAFSSFCTALVFWLILKWENRADMPHSDRYLILIAYVIGVSIAVHLLNLLCIPAIVLVFYYRKFSNTNAKGSILALLVSFVIVALILYGLVPGFIEVAQYSELFFVNVLGMNYNIGVLIYAILTVACFIWTISELYRQESATRIKISFALSILMSGIPFIGSSLWIPVLVMTALLVWLQVAKKLQIRILNIVTLSIFVIFIGYSSYALLLIRSSADTPVNQNAPDNVFSLASYLNREQYGESPLLYGTTFKAEVKYDKRGRSISSETFTRMKAVPNADGSYKPHYDKVLGAPDYEYVSELCTLFPRMYDSRHASGYMRWGGFSEADMKQVRFKNFSHEANAETWQTALCPTFGQNISYFVNYQLVHMYFRYFMWNFAGRQNDLQGNGEINRGNWISGIPVIDNARLGDQSLLPEEYGTGNKGHNVFFMLPLILGLVGLIWQSLKGDSGIRQFWVIFFLFFMTGIAIVLYLNQTPGQPRERDYAFAGSFYAFAIWIGLGVGAIASGISKLMKNKTLGVPASIAAAIIGLCVPLQMVSQTWDDHDRSGRYTARDFGMNYLSSLEPNAIIFTNGDNDTFPLWYAQEVEGYRTDVRVINLSYLGTDWYAAQQLLPSYDAKAVSMMANPQIFGQNRRSQGFIINNDSAKTALQFLEEYYSDNADLLSKNKYREFGINAPIGEVGTIVIPASNENEDSIKINLSDALSAKWGGQPMIALSDALVLDIIATSAANGWDRSIYFANTVPEEYYLGFKPYMQNTGMAQKVIPKAKHSADLNLKAYDNIARNFRWGGLDAENGENVYLDETVQRMVSSTRLSVMTTIENLYSDGEYELALDLLNLMREKLPTENTPLGIQFGSQMGRIYLSIGEKLNNPAIIEEGKRLYAEELSYYASMLPWLANLTPNEFNSLSLSDRVALYYPETFRMTEETATPESLFINAVYDYAALCDTNEELTDFLISLSEKYGFDYLQFFEVFHALADEYVKRADAIKAKSIDKLNNLYGSYPASIFSYDYESLSPSDKSLYREFIAEYEHAIAEADNIGRRMQYLYLSDFLSETKALCLYSR